MEQDPVTQQLHGGPVVPRRDLAGQLRERKGHLCRSFITGPFRQLGIAREVREHRRLQRAGRTAPHACLLERGLDMVELMLVHEDFRVPAEQPSEQVLAGAAGT